MADTWVKLSCRLYGLAHRKDFGASRALEGNAAYMGRDEKYWWGYKFYCSPIEKAEPGSGLEEFFRDQDLDFLDERGYPHVGTARSPEERDAVVMIERCGVKVAFISFTFALNWKEPPKGKEYLANYLRLNKPDTDIAPIARQVAAARAAGADAIVACLHWSLEFESYPVRNVVGMGHKLIELGIDVIIGNHPHNIQPIEKYSYVDKVTGSRKAGLIMYALGDLISVREKVLPNSHLGLLAHVKISKGRIGGKDCARVSGLEILPTYLYPKMEKGVCGDFRILDFRKLARELCEGKNRLGLSRMQIREIHRLEALMNKVLYAALKEGRGAPPR